MVALSPRFAVLAAFISLTSLSTSPLSVGAAVIPRAEENVNMARFFDSSRLQSAFSLYQAKAMKRHDDHDVLCDDLVCLWLGGWKVVKRAQYPRGIVGRAEEQEENGKIAIISSDGQDLGYLKVEKNEQDSQPNSYTVKDSRENPTIFTLVEESSASVSDVSHDALRVVSLRVAPPGRSGSTEKWCVGYSTLQNGAFSVSSCERSGKNDVSQSFGFNETSRHLSPLRYTSPGSPDRAQSVLSRADGGQDTGTKGIYLRFMPESMNAEDVDETPTGGPPTATMTKTVTVTNAPTASLSAADTSATPSADASSSASMNSTSTANGAAPTAGVPGTVGAAPTAGAPGTAGTASTAGAPGTAGVLDVEVVQPSSEPSAIASTSASSASAAPTTTMSPQDIAASIANSSAAPSSTANGSSAIASPSSTGTGSSSAGSSSAPSARAVRRGPYKWL